MYSVKEIFLTLQGEGYNAGKRAVFVRFSGCNMWSGRGEDRDKGPGPCSKWCDTDFVDGRKMLWSQLMAEILLAWGEERHNRFVVFTGGEPALQFSDELVTGCYGMGFQTAIETNGTIELPNRGFWTTVSPKTEKLAVTSGDELKLVYPTLDPTLFEKMAFNHFYLQPLDGPSRAENTMETIDYIKQHPNWRLSIQMHKMVGLP